MPQPTTRDLLADALAAHDQHASNAIAVISEADCDCEQDCTDDCPADCDGDHTCDCAPDPAWTAAAQVHATLALAAAGTAQALVALIASGN
jgi:hypothetical protein